MSQERDEILLQTLADLPLTSMSWSSDDPEIQTNQLDDVYIFLCLYHKRVFSWAFTHRQLMVVMLKMLNDMKHEINAGSIFFVVIYWEVRRTGFCIFCRFKGFLRQDKGTAAARW